MALSPPCGHPGQALHANTFLRLSGPLPPVQSGLSLSSLSLPVCVGDDVQTDDGFVSFVCVCLIKSAEGLPTLFRGAAGPAGTPGARRTLAARLTARFPRRHLHASPTSPCLYPLYFPLVLGIRNLMGPSPSPRAPLASL